MHYGTIKTHDIANGIGVRVSLFVSGCTNRCSGCFNEETWDFNYGEAFTKESEDTILNALQPNYIRGLTILGGEPFEPSNQRGLLPLIHRVKERYPDKDIWMYTGFVLEDLLPSGKRYCEVTDDILNSIDVLVDGKFELTQLDITLRFRGSRNQRLIDMRKTREQKRIIEWNE